MPRTEAEAALIHAAEVAEANPDPVPRNDQFIYTSGLLRNGPPGGPWKSYRDRGWGSVDGRRYGLSYGHGEKMTDGVPGELIPPPEPGEPVPIRWGYPELQRLPREPKALLAHLQKKGLIGHPEPSLFHALREILTFPVLPPGLRPASFRALSGLPGVEIRRGEKDASGRTGVGVLAPNIPHEQGYIMIFDPRTYRYLGHRDTYVEDVGRDGVKKGKLITDWSARLRAGIVDKPGELP